MSIGTFHTMEGENSESNSLIILQAGSTWDPDIVEYDRIMKSQPGFDLILGPNALKELGIVQNFWTIEIDIDKIILPMRVITKLSTRTKIERA